MSRIQIVAIVLIAVPALVAVLWPLWRERGSWAAPVRPADRRLELLEDKAAVYRALQELDFDHEAGHLSDDDYGELRARYESRAAELLAALDALEPVPAISEPEPAPEVPAARRGWTRHPAALAGGGVLLLVFGVTLGFGVSRFTEPETPMAPPRAPAPGESVAAGPRPGGLQPGQPIPPEMLAGMLSAARASLREGRYSEAIAAYQAVLKRDPKNVDAMTHLGLIVAIGGHADAALEALDKAAQIDPGYAPLYLYRGQVLLEMKQDRAGAVKSWERFLALVPAGEDHDRVAELVKEVSKKP